MNEELFKFIKYFIRYTILFLTGSILFSQWNSFQISDENKNSESIFRYAGFATVNDSPIDIINERRVSIAGSISTGNSTEGLIPVLHGKMKISWNLSIKGRMASFSSDDGSIQMYGWGLTLKPGSIEDPSKWRILFDSGSLNSHNQLKISSMSTKAVRSVEFKNFPIYYGFGTNILNGISLKTLNNYELHSNFLLFGLSKIFFGIIVSPQILVGGENNYLSISLLNHF